MSQAIANIKIAVISDLHVMAPELLVNEGPAIEEYLAQDRKMLRESAEILDTLVGDIIDLKPDSSNGCFPEVWHTTNDNIDNIDKIPFAVGEYGAAPVQNVEMDAIVKKVSGVDVPLFEAKMPYKSLLNGLDHQLIVNLVAEREDLGQYEGLQVGSITAPNNNAGNWE